MKRQLISRDEVLPCTAQHKSPCSDCPFSRTALKGWLGGMTADEYFRLAHSDEVINCHVKDGPQCAGAAIYRANVGKLPRDKSVLRLPPNRKAVFATPMEFLAYHNDHKGA